nr:MAG TPA: tail tube protein [Caudoviricetes sp.]
MGSKTVKVPIGMRSSYFAKIKTEPENAHPTYDPKVDMGAAVKGYVSITTASGEIPGDDVILMRSERFVSAQADVETTKSDLELNALCFGHTFSEESGEESSSDDEAPVGAYAFVEPVMDKTKKVTYRATFLRKVQAVASSEKTEADTKKNDFSPKMNSISFFVMPDNTGSWRARKEFDTEAAAENYIDSLFLPTA